MDKSISQPPAAPERSTGDGWQSIWPRSLPTDTEWQRRKKLAVRSGHLAMGVMIAAALGGTVAADVGQFSGWRLTSLAVAGLEVAGEAAHGEEAVRQVSHLEPEVVLMDLRMPQMGGVEATRRVRETRPECRVIVLTTFDDDEEVFDALRAGAVGYLLKDAPLEKLMEAIRAAARGESFLQPSIAAKVVAEFSRLSHPRSTARAKLVEQLSEREREVLRHLGSGKSNKEIAAALHLAEGTVKNHMTNILGKLGVMDRTQAALKARELGWL